MREWAKSNGHQVSDRGRISVTVQEAYDAAHEGLVTSRATPPDLLAGPLLAPALASLLGQHAASNTVTPDNV